MFEVNRYLFRGISFLLTFLIFISCKTSSPLVGETPKQEEKAKVPEPSRGAYNPSRTKLFDLIHTKLDVSFNWENESLNGIADLTLVPYFYAQDSLTLDAKGFDIANIVLEPERTVLDYRYDGAKLHINLGKTYTRRDTFTVEIEYVAKPNELPVGGSEAIASDKGLFFINADGKDPYKPRQIWTQGETEASSKWFPTIDSPNERTSQEMYITVDTTFTILTNGEFYYSTPNGDGTKTEYWRMELPHAPYLFMMVVGEFAVVEDVWKDIPVNYYVEPKFKAFAKNVFGNTPEMLTFFSEKLNYPFPWPKYSQIVVRDYVSGAMENTTATIFMEALQVDDRALLDANWDYIIAHELFHHWFGDLVTCESWANLPLNESFANYSEYLWAEYKFGLDEADYHGSDELEGYLEEASEKQEPLIRYHYLDKEDMFDAHSYNKGGRVLHMLRNYVGDEAFFKSLSLYLKKHQFTSVEVNNLRLAFEEITGEDLNWFFNQWFHSSGHPVLSVDHSWKEGSLVLNVSQIQDTTYTPVYKLPLKVSIWVGGQKQIFEVVIDKPQQQFLFNIGINPDLVIIDSDHVLLGLKDHKKDQSEWIFQYNKGERYLTRMEALQNIFVGEADEKNPSGPFSDVQNKEILKSALQDPFWAIRDYALDQFSIFLVSDIETFIPIIEKMAESDQKPAVKAHALRLLYSYNYKKYVHLFKKGMKEKPYSVVGASLYSYLMYLQKENISLDIQLDEFEQMDNLDVAISLAQYYLGSGVQGKYPWFEDLLLRNKGNGRMLYNMLAFFAAYANKAGISEKEKAILILKDIQENNPHEVIREQAGLIISELN